MSKKFTIQFDGYKDLAEMLDKLNGDLIKTAEEALDKSHEYVTPKLQKAMIKHRVNKNTRRKNTGETERSLITKSNAHHEGMIVSVDVGFKIRKGGLPSIFLMYGTPKMKPDKELYNALYGTKTKKDLKEIQKKVFEKALRKAGG